MDNDQVGTPLLDASFVADAYADEEMGPGAGSETIIDDELEGCRLLLVQRAAETIQLEGGPGGALEIACTFQPAEGMRFSWARIVLRLKEPAGVKVVDLGPRDVREAEPVKFTVSGKGKLGLKYQIAEAGVENGLTKEFAVYHCTVHGSGESTPTVRWDFTENPHRRDGIGREQVLVLTLPVTGRVAGTITANARIVRPGIAGRLDAIRDLVLGARSNERAHEVSFEIPEPAHESVLSRIFG
jgi:hypothetical protein